MVQPKPGMGAFAGTALAQEEISLARMQDYGGVEFQRVQRRSAEGVEQHQRVVDGKSPEFIRVGDLQLRAGEIFRCKYAGADIHPLHGRHLEDPGKTARIAGAAVAKDFDTGLVGLVRPFCVDGHLFHRIKPIYILEGEKRFAVVLHPERSVVLQVLPERTVVRQGKRKPVTGDPILLRHGLKPRGAALICK